MNNKWPDYWMTMAENTAQLSKDPRTKVGAVIVKNKKLKSIGYNGAPEGFPDEKVPKDNTGTRLIDKKNTFMCHAELNAVLNYEGHLTDLKGSDVYLTLSPCTTCTCMLSQLKIKRIIYKTLYDKEEVTEASKYIIETNKNPMELIDFETFKERETK